MTMSKKIENCEFCQNNARISDVKILKTIQLPLETLQ